MSFQILINIVIAIIWTFLQNNYSIASFLFGYAIGLFLLFMLRRFLVSDFYFTRVWSFIKLIFLFLKELVKANIDVIKIVLNPNLSNYHPGIVAVPTETGNEFRNYLISVPDLAHTRYDSDGFFR